MPTAQPPISVKLQFLRNKCQPRFVLTSAWASQSSSHASGTVFLLMLKVLVYGVMLSVVQNIRYDSFESHAREHGKQREEVQASNECSVMKLQEVIPGLIDVAGKLTHVRAWISF